MANLRWMGMDDAGRPVWAVALLCECGHTDAVHYEDTGVCYAEGCPCRAIVAARDHDGHGRGTADEGPDDPDCPCRGTDQQGACADAGCGFCRAAEPRSAPSEPEGETPKDDRLAIQDYPAAARSIALNLAEFCDESLPYPAMIAESARRARTELTALRAVREAAERVAATGYVLGPDWYGVSADALSTLRTVLLRAALASSRSETGATTEVPNAGL